MYGWVPSMIQKEEFLLSIKMHYGNVGRITASAVSWLNSSQLWNSLSATRVPALPVVPCRRWEEAVINKLVTWSPPFQCYPSLHAPFWLISFLVQSAKQRVKLCILMSAIDLVDLIFIFWNLIVSREHKMFSIFGSILPTPPWVYFSTFIFYLFTPEYTLF